MHGQSVTVRVVASVTVMVLEGLIGIVVGLKRFVSMPSETLARMRFTHPGHTVV